MCVLVGRALGYALGNESQILKTGLVEESNEVRFDRVLRLLFDTASFARGDVHQPREFERIKVNLDLSH